MPEELIPIVAIIAVFGTGSLKILTSFLLEWRRSGSNRDLEELRQQVSQLSKDYQQVKADHTDTLLGMEMDMRRLESRLDGQAGIEAPPVAVERAAPPQRQL